VCPALHRPYPAPYQRCPAHRLQHRFHPPALVRSLMYHPHPHHLHLARHHHLQRCPNPQALGPSLQEQHVEMLILCSLACSCSPALLTHSTTQQELAGQTPRLAGAAW
jgi:hypothetical protein